MGCRYAHLTQLRRRSVDHATASVEGVELQPTCKLIGLPFDGASSFLRGPAKAPAEVRRVLHAGSANWFTERGVEVRPATDGKTDGWVDVGDLRLVDDPASARHQIIAGVTEATHDGSRIVSIGGDHFVTWPIVEALSSQHQNLTIVHIDAHPDIYDELDGDPLSHACPFARIMEAGLATRLIQYGIRTATTHQREQVERFGVEMFEVSTWDGSFAELECPVYLSIDVDGLDPAFAPGVSHHEPGGLTMRQVLDIIHNIAEQGVEVVGADIVEINPDRDIHDMTAMVGAKLVRECFGLFVKQ